MKIDLDFGILYQEILVCALKEHELSLRRLGNNCRADVVADLLSKIPF